MLRIYFAINCVNILNMLMFFYLKMMVLYAVVCYEILVNSNSKFSIIL